MVIDQRGFNYILKAEAATFLSHNDTRLRLNTTVTNINWGNDSVTVTTNDGRKIRAKHAICTFSLGVLQNSALGTPNAPVSFTPQLPAWKREAISSFGFGT